MKLTNEEIIVLSNQTEPDKWIKEARIDTDKLRMHVYGTNIANYLDRLEVFENKEQYELRVKYAPSNQPYIENNFAPFNHIFGARGTTVNVGLKDKTLTEKLNSNLLDVKAGMSVKSYLKDIWKYNFLVEPNGLTFLEVKKDGSKAYLTSKSIFKIRSMKVHGLIPEYVVFEPHKTDKDGNSEFWIVDDAMYYYIRKSGDKVTIVKEESKPNLFGRVPAFINSTIMDTNRAIRVSPIWGQITMWDTFLLHNSNLEIFKAKHGYPIFWYYAQYERQVIPIRKHPLDQAITPEFPIAPTGRKKKKDVSDGIALSLPLTKDDPTIAPNVAGYVSPSIETWRQMEETKRQMLKDLRDSLWNEGINERVSGNSTATEVNKGYFNVAAKLNDFAEIVQKAHKEIIDLFGKFIAPSSYESKATSVNYSRRYLLESPDVQFQKYKDAKKDGVPESELDQLLMAYYQSEYSSDEMMLIYWSKVMDIDPLPHNSISECLTMAVPQWMKDCKLYLGGFLSDTPKEVIITTPINQLKTNFYEYVRIKKQELETVQQVQDLQKPRNGQNGDDEDENGDD